MEILASVRNRQNEHRVEVVTNGRVSKVAIPVGASGYGSSVNGGELLCLAIATCYCNDIYREAADRLIAIREVSVEVSATFGGRGDAASEISYSVTLSGDADQHALIALAEHADTVAEVHNTLRLGIPVTLTSVAIDEW